MASAVYKIEVDWNNNGSFADADEDITADVKSISYSRGKDEELGKANPGTLQIRVNNSDGKYSPTKNSGIYTNLLPKRVIKVTTTSPATYNLFYGYIETITPHPNPASQDCYISAIDGLDYLARHELDTILYKDQLTGYLVGKILDAAGWGIAIDIGADAIDRGTGFSNGFTVIDLANPADGTGIITNIEVWAQTNITGLRVGIFYLVSGTTYKCRSSVAISDIIAGSNQTFAVSLEVNAGDYIGCYFASGTLEADTTGFSGIMWVSGEYIDSGDEVSYTLASEDAISLYGTNTVLRSIDAGQDVVPFAYWQKVRARFALGDIEDSELAFIFINGAGELAYEDRHHRYSATHQTSQATFDDTMVDITYDYNARNVFNEIRATITPWELQSLATLWVLEEIPSIAAGITSTWWGDASVGGIPVFVDEWTIPISTTDYTANSAEDGSGDDETTNISIVTTRFAQSIKLAITNNASHLVWITKLQARGTYYDSLTKVSRKSEDSTSQGLYQKRTLSLDGKYLTDADKAQDFCDYGIAQFKDPQAEVVITIVNKNDTNLTQILAREISDRITVKHTKLGLDADFFINKMEHEITEGGKRHKCLWYLVDAFISDFWSLGFSELNVGTKLGY